MTPSTPPNGAEQTSAAYAPLRDDGLKPWVRESYHFGKTHLSIEYAATAAEVKNRYARMHLEKVRVRRATVDDVEELSGR